MFLRRYPQLLLCLAYAATQPISAPASSSCESALQPTYPAPSLAPGYKAQLIATNLTKPCGLISDSNGHLLVVQQGVGITSLRIQDQGDDCLQVSHKVDVVQNANLTHGIALSGDGKTLYASSAQVVFSWPYDAAKSSASGIGNDLIAVTNKSGGDHITRALLFAKKQKDTLIVSRSSVSNVDFDSLDLTTGHCQIKSFAVQKDNMSVQYSTPLENFLDGACAIPSASRSIP